MIDIETTLDTLPHTHPYIAAFGTSLHSLKDPVVVIEKTNVIRTNSLSDAIHVAFASYYVFDIKYPRNIKNLLVFMEQLVYKLKPTMSVTMAANVVIDSIMKL